MEKTTMSKNYIIEQIKEAKNTGSVFIETDYEPIRKISIEYGDFDAGYKFFISFFKIHNFQPNETRWSKTVNEALNDIGTYIPDFLKLRNNF